MKSVDCFLLIGTALSLNNNQDLPETVQPVLHNSTATCVKVSLSLEEMRVIDINSMETDISMLLHQRWTDLRLGDNTHTRNMAVAGQIWRPRITITNGLKKSCTNDEDTQFWRGFGSDGNVLLSEKLAVKTYCTRNFKRFPFDVQICTLKFGTYRYPMDEVQLTWNLKPVEVLMRSDLNQFELSNVSVFHEVDVRPSGNFSILVVQLTITRYYMHYIICIVTPCMILVSLAYASFWIDRRQSGFRMALSLVVVLSLTSLYYVSVCLTVKVPFLKSLDKYVLLCSTFSSISFVESCVLNYVFSNELVSSNKNLNVGYMEVALRIIYPLFYTFCIFVLLYCTL